LSVPAFFAAWYCALHSLLTLPAAAWAETGSARKPAPARAAIPASTDLETSISVLLAKQAKPIGAHRQFRQSRTDKYRPAADLCHR
jgi:hypothetical protein